MGTRLDLHAQLRTIADRAYYQPPKSVQMTYPCIVYDLSSDDSRYANNHAYKNDRRYSVQYISKDVADDVIAQMKTTFSYCRFDRHYTADNLHHYQFFIYY